MASEGYPGHYERDRVINNLEEAERMPDVKVFHAGTALRTDPQLGRDGRIVTDGGRVLDVTALGDDPRRGPGPRLRGRPRHPLHRRLVSPRHRRPRHPRASTDDAPPARLARSRRTPLAAESRRTPWPILGECSDAILRACMDCAKLSMAWSAVTGLRGQWSLRDRWLATPPVTRLWSGGVVWRRP